MNRTVIQELIITSQHNKSATVVLNLFHCTKRLHLQEESMMKSLYEELGGTYTLADDGMLYCLPVSVRNHSRL